MDNKAFRRLLRKQQTPAENVLWKLLRNRKLEGKKFRRQQELGPYTVDFVCLEDKLIVELDGAVHFQPGAADRDMEREDWLKQNGFVILRFENKFVLEQQANVMAEIARHLGIEDFQL